MSNHKATRQEVFAMLTKFGPISTPELAKKMNLLPATVNWHIQTLHDERLVHVKDFSKERGRTHMRIWAVGAAEDATRGEKFDRYAYYYSDDPDESASVVAIDMKRRRELLASIKPFRDPMIWATAGRAA